MTEEELNKAKYELERERFEFEKERSSQEGRFFSRYFAAIISTAISLAALSVSASQVWVAHIEKQREINDKQAELNIAKLHNENELAQEKIRDDRKWDYDTLQFVSSNKDVIFGGDPLQQERIRDVMVVTFPIKVLDSLLPGLRARAQRTKSPGEEKIWSDGEKSVDAKNIDSSNAPEVKLPTDILDRDELRKQLTSPERRSVSNRLIELYNQRKKDVVDALINAILPESDTNSYRNNLYIAVTLGGISSWEGSDDQLNLVDDLKKTKNYHDPTFRKWVDQAAANGKRRPL
jgi:hypothetical protein